MVQYIIQFDKPIRLGQEVVECVGPFDSLDEAKFYLFNAERAWAIKPPPAMILSMISASD